IAKLNTGEAPLFEPGLDALVQNGMASGNLRFTTDFADAMRGARYVWLTYDTPVNDRDEVELSGIMSATQNIARYLEDDAVIVVHSQVPVGTCENIESTVAAIARARRFGIAYVPENLRLGKALECFHNPAMMVIGSNQANTLDRVEAFCSKLRCQ